MTQAPELPEEHLRSQVKHQLRIRMRNLRDTLPVQAREARSARIIQRLKNTAELKNAQVLAGYDPIKSEISLRPFFSEWLADGKTLCLPRMDHEKQELSFHQVNRLETLQTGVYGIAEPPIDAPILDPAELQIMLVPALAVDLAGYRVGYGKGHYDRYLSQSQTPAFRICAVYDFQLIPEAPAQAHDETVQLVITDSASYPIATQRRT